MAGISDVNEALGVANHVDEYAFAEAILIGTSKADLQSIFVTFEQNKEQYEELAGKLDSVKAYYEGLAKVLNDNELPSYNESTASEQAEKMAEEAKVIKEQTELMMKFMNQMIEKTSELQTRANQLSGHAKTLQTQAKAVIERS